MKAKRRIVDNATIEYNTWNSKSEINRTIEMAEKFKTDPDKKQRHEWAECPVCYYIKSRIGGAAMTTAECGLCGAEKLFPSTNVDVLCVDCAKKHNLCCHCGGDIDSKNRKKQRF